MLPSLALLLTLVALGAWAVGAQHAWARRLTLPCAVGNIVTPLLIPGPPLLRFVLATAGMLAAARSLDLARDPRRWPFATRLWLATSMVDIRQLRSVPRSLSVKGAALTVAFALLAAIGYFIAFDLAPTASPRALRWLGGVIFIYGVAETFNHGATSLFLLGGYRPRRLHYAPVLAVSVGAFWSRHYNLSVSDWLGRNVYRPWARRGRPRMGLALAFFVSAAFHAWLAYVPLDLPMAGLMGLFFLVQGSAILLEQSLAQARWPQAARRLWTMMWMLGSAPLFVEPFLRMIAVR